MKKPVTDKKPIIWGYRYWSYSERGMDSASYHLCGGLFVYKIMNNENKKEVESETSKILRGAVGQEMLESFAKKVLEVAPQRMTIKGKNKK